MNFKKILSYIFAFSLFGTISARQGNFKFNPTFAVPVSKAIHSNPTNPAHIQTNTFGKLMEPIITKTLQEKSNYTFNFIDASYRNGTNGIDAFAIDTKTGQIHVIEYKTNDAVLGKPNAGNQMSIKWIQNSLSEHISEIKTDIKKLNHEIKRAKKSGDKITQSLKETELSMKNNEKKQFEYYRKNAREWINSGKMTRTIIRLELKNGKAVISGADIDNKQGYNKAIKPKEKKLYEFSILDKDYNSLNDYNKNMRAEILASIEKDLESKGYSEAERADFLRKLTTEPDFDPYRQINIKGWEQSYYKAVKKALLRDGFSEEKTEMILEKFMKGDRLSKNYRGLTEREANQANGISDEVYGRFNKQVFITQNVIKFGFIIVSVVSIAKAVYDLYNHTIDGVDFGLSIISNGLGIFSAFTVMPHLTAIYIAIDIVQNIIQVARGRITYKQALVNVISNTAALLGAGIVSAKIGLMVGKINPALGIGAGLISFTALYFGIKMGINWVADIFSEKPITSQKYQSIKNPKDFSEYCWTVSKYAI